MGIASSPPLAEQLRPQELTEVVGQEHLIGNNRPLSLYIQNKNPPSLIFWGNPGTGKTTLAKLLAQKSGKKILQFSAVTLSVTELKKIFSQAEQNQQETLCVFIDEIHRFNKAQQDALLHPLESGLITLIGATTENPSFTLNSALLSRVQVLVLNRLEEKHLLTLWERAQKYLQQSFTPHIQEIQNSIIVWADGDARKLYNLMENLIHITDLENLTVPELETMLSQKTSLYDRDGEQHYSLISALHKSIRGSDVDASLYWLARMLNGGEDPRYLARRLLRIAYEDIGLSDPQAPQVALSTWETYERLGSPEGEIALAELVAYLALAPKSNRIYTAVKQAQKTAHSFPSEPPPPHIINPVTNLMKKKGYGKGYRYDHDEEHGFSGQNYFPEKMERLIFYTPKEIGFERKLKQRLDYFNQLRQQKNQENS